MSTDQPDPAAAVHAIRDKLWNLRKPDGSSGADLDAAIAYCDQKIVEVAYCPDHGLHGARDTCFVCGKPVQQIPMCFAGERPDGDSHWATVVIDDAFEPRELTEAESVLLYESGIGIDVERMWIRPGVRKGPTATNEDTGEVTPYGEALPPLQDSERSRRAGLRGSGPRPQNSETIIPYQQVKTERDAALDALAHEETESRRLAGMVMSLDLLVMSANEIICNSPGNIQPWLDACAVLGRNLTPRGE
jgi:hypothetical protein